MGAKYTQAQGKATQKYIKKVYDEFRIRVKKGKKAEYIAKAAKENKSLNQYVIDLIEADIDNKD